MNCCHAQLGEDEPVIIFKFAIIDLRKSYCDKNELIIKFISEINSAMIKPLAAAAGAARGVAFRAAKSPRQARPGSPAGHDEGHCNRAPLPLAVERAALSPGRGGQNARLGLRSDAEAGCPPPPGPPGPPVAQRCGGGAASTGSLSRGAGNEAQMWSQRGEEIASG